jgi:hypothetical protein
VLQRTAVDAQHDRPLPRPDRLDRAEGNGTPPSQEQAPSANDDFVGMIGVPLIADVIEPSKHWARAPAGVLPGWRTGWRTRINSLQTGTF